MLSSVKHALITHLIPFVIFLVGFLIYFQTTARLPVNIADSNELMTAAYQYGLAHPPGYPFYTLLLSVIMHVPHAANPAFVANLSSAAFQSLALVCFYLCLQTLLSQLNKKLNPYSIVYLSCIGTAILGFSYLYWDVATFAEVYGLNSLLIGLVILFLLNGTIGKKPILFWSLFGLAVSHHQTAIFLLPGCIYVIASHKNPFSWPKAAGAFIAAALLPYLLPFVFNRNASISWYFEPSLTGLWQLASRGIYALNGSDATPINLTLLIHSTVTLVDRLISHFSLPAVLLIIVGLLCLKKKNQTLFRFLFITLLIAGPFLATYLRLSDIELAGEEVRLYSTYLSSRIFLTFEYVAALLIPIGMLELFQLFQKSLSPLKQKVVFGLMACIPVYLLVNHYQIIDKHDSNFDSLFSQQILQTAPPNSLIIIDSDVAFNLLYIQTIQQLRPDVLLVPTAMHMRWGYLHTHLPQDIFKVTGYYTLIESLTKWGYSQNRPVLVLEPRTQLINYLEQNRYSLTPNGYLIQVATQPQTVAAYDYGLTYQLTFVDIPKKDVWSQFGKAELSALHTNLAYVSARSNAIQVALSHLAIAAKLSSNTDTDSRFNQVSQLVASMQKLQVESHR